MLSCRVPCLVEAPISMYFCCSSSSDRYLNIKSLESVRSKFNLSTINCNTECLNYDIFNF